MNFERFSFLNLSVSLPNEGQMANSFLRVGEATKKNNPGKCCIGFQFLNTSSQIVENWQFRKKTNTVFCLFHPRFSGLTPAVLPMGRLIVASNSSFLCRNYASLKNGTFSGDLLSQFVARRIHLHQVITSPFPKGQRISTQFEHKKRQEKGRSVSAIPIQRQDIGINKEAGKKQSVFSALNDRRSTFYTSYSKLSEVKLLTIGIASPLRILQWAEKTLPNGKIYGEVLNPNTLHHKTFKPQKGGLFCERIFGPLKDFECACGKSDKSRKIVFSASLRQEGSDLLSTTKKQNDSLAASLWQPVRREDGSLARSEPFGDKPNSKSTSSQEVDKSIPIQADQLQHTRKFCPDCDVEYTWSVIRRYQLGYIKLNSPVAHIWFLRGTPSYLSILLDIKKRHLQYITYCSETFTLENSLNNKGIILDSPAKIFESWQNLMNLSKTKHLSSTMTTNSNFQPVTSFTQRIDSGLLSAEGALGDNKGKKKEAIISVATGLASSSLRAGSGGSSGPAVFPENLQQVIPQKQGSFASVKEKRLKRRQSSIKLVETVRDRSAFFFSLPLAKGGKQSNSSLRDEKGINFKTNSFSIETSLNISGLASRAKQEGSSTPLLSLKVPQSNNVDQSFLPKERFHLSIDGNNEVLSSLLAALQVSINYKSVGKRNLKVNNVQALYIPLLVTINKKLPIDLYILNSLERLLHKASLILSINKTWQQTYKNSYTKALKKVVAFLARQKTFNPEGSVHSSKQIFALDFCPFFKGNSKCQFNHKTSSFLEELLLQSKKTKSKGSKYLEYDSFGKLRLSSKSEPEDPESLTQTLWAKREKFDALATRRERNLLAKGQEAFDRPLHLKETVRQLENAFVKPPFRKFEENGALFEQHENNNPYENLSTDHNGVSQFKNHFGQSGAIDGLLHHQINTFVNERNSIEKSFKHPLFGEVPRLKKVVSRSVTQKRSKVIKSKFRANRLGTKKIPSIQKKLLTFSAKQEGNRKAVFSSDRAKHQYQVSAFYEILRTIDSFAVNKLNAVFQKSNRKNIGLLMRTIKKYFINIIFICLQKLKQPILLLDSLIITNFRLSTMIFSKENTNKEVIESRLSLDFLPPLFAKPDQKLRIQKNSQKKGGFLDYFLLNTDLIENLLTKALLRPLLLAQLSFPRKKQQNKMPVASSISGIESNVRSKSGPRCSKRAQPFRIKEGNKHFIADQNPSLKRAKVVPPPFQGREEAVHSFNMFAISLLSNLFSWKKKCEAGDLCISSNSWEKEATSFPPSSLRTGPRCSKRAQEPFEKPEIRFSTGSYQTGEKEKNNFFSVFHVVSRSKRRENQRRKKMKALFGNYPSLYLIKEFKRELKNLSNPKSKAINKIQQSLILEFYKTFSQIQGSTKELSTFARSPNVVAKSVFASKGNWPEEFANSSEKAYQKKSPFKNERNFILSYTKKFQAAALREPTTICPILFGLSFSELQVQAIRMIGLKVPAFVSPLGRTGGSESPSVGPLLGNGRSVSSGSHLSSSFFDTVIMNLYFCLYKSLSQGNNKKVVSLLERGCFGPFLCFDGPRVAQTKGREVFSSFVSRSKGQVNKIYNNVYTLSHRERWQGEKDWQFFSIFNNSLPNYYDVPIFSYKNRIFLVSHNSFLFNEFSLAHEQKKQLPFGLALRDPLGINPRLAKTPSQFDANLGGISNTNLNVPLARDYKKESQKYMAQNKILNAPGQNQMYYTLSNAFYSGPGIVQLLLNELNFNELKKLDKQNRLVLYELNKQIFKSKKQVQVFIYDKVVRVELKNLCKKRDLLIRRTKLVRKLFRNESGQNTPSSMILTVLPVLPPDLRPIVKMGGEAGQIAASDFNRLYQRVIYRNDRLKKFLKDSATNKSYEMKYAQRLLQEAVDNLMQNGKSGVNSEKDARGRALKSLSDILKGKQGRFRQFLLGKRVDYSGRSVIVVGPKLKLHECGLPLEMARELYLPFLLKTILNKNYAKTVIGAKTLIKNHPSLAYELLREIMQVSPILLNRAPTLHRLGIQAFVPKLIEGRAILLHPLVCAAFNADFDGDQMAVHVPITVEARAEAWKLMLSRNNILSPATGDPLAIPSQDMVLGCYYLTTFSNNGNILPGSGLYFKTIEDVLKAYNLHKVHLHAIVWVKWTDHIENGNDQEEPIEIRVSTDGNCQEISSHYYRIYNSSNLLISQYMSTTPGRLLFNSVIQKIM